MPDKTQTSPDEGASAFLADLADACEVQEFSPGDVLRQKGRHYRNLYIITEGEVAVYTDPGDDKVEPIPRGPGQPIGEIGFLRGAPANADVIAHRAARGLMIDDPTLARLEAERPDLVVRLLQRLGEIADDRTSYNLTLPDDEDIDEQGADVEILMCRNDGMLAEAQRLRYEVYCEELGRSSPSADDEAKTIADGLDEFGHCFIAVRGGKTVGTIRVNFAREGSIGMLEDLYGMKDSDRHPDQTAITTKFIVKQKMRGSPTAMQLVSRVATYSMGEGISECFIDCIPDLVHYYRAMGFRPTQETFFHPENGPSLPMRLDLKKHGKQLVGEVGISRMVAFYLKAKALKFTQGLGA